MRVVPIPLRLSRAYAAVGRRAVLVDTGSPGEADRVLAALAAAGVAPETVALILLTHHHADHAGNAAALSRRLGVPVAAHADDMPWLAEGRNAPVQAHGATGRVVRRFANFPFEPVRPEVRLEEGQRLDGFGLDATILHTPGHTPGSVSLLLDDGQAIAGDLLMGGFLGGAVASGRPGHHYFVDSEEAVRDHAARLLQRGARVVHVGHGGPLAASAVRAWLQRPQAA